MQACLICNRSLLSQERRLSPPNLIPAKGVILHGDSWRVQNPALAGLSGGADGNRTRPPECHSGALPTELRHICLQAPIYYRPSFHRSQHTRWTNRWRCHRSSSRVESLTCSNTLPNIGCSCTDTTPDPYAVSIKRRDLFSSSTFTHIRKSDYMYLEPPGLSTHAPACLPRHSQATAHLHKPLQFRLRSP